MAQTQYQNMDKDCIRILPQGKGLHNSRKLRKTVAIDKTGKLIISNKSLKEVPGKRYKLRKSYLTQQIYTFYVSGITLSNNNYRRKNLPHNRV